jgi:TRAP-type C4-dicarboxylate transport system substrate-binding protein
MHERPQCDIDIDDEMEETMTRRSQPKASGHLNRRQTLMLAGASAIAGLSMPRSGSAQSRPITLKGVTPYTADFYLSKPLFIFKEMVEERTNGRLKIDHIGGEEVIRGIEQFEALRNGVIDVAMGITSYYSGTVPEGLALQYNKDVLPSDSRKNGFYDLMRKIHLDKGGVVYLAWAGGNPGTAFRLYTKVKVNKPDFTNLRIRVSPVYTALVKALNGTPVSIPWPDTYAALERGIADGFGSTYGGITDYGLHEVSKYVIDHPFYTLNNTIILNKASWDKLRADLRQQLEALAPEYERKVEDFFANYVKDEDQRLKAKGMEFIRFSNEDAKKYVDTAYLAGWADFVAKNPEIGPKLKALLNA